MTTRWYILIAFTALLFSCKKELHVAKNTPQQPVWASGKAHSTLIPEENTLPGEMLIEEKAATNTIAEKTPLTKKNEGATLSKEEKKLLKKEIRKEIKAQKKIQKETDPRLSRALWMTIFGGVATTLGIVFMAYAPTGLFVFAFGLVFIVGIVSLIMYLANPKPKM